MHLEEIEYIIKPDGKVEIKVKGVKGEECMKLTEVVESKLGEVIACEKTQEYYEQQTGTRLTTYQG